MAQAAAHIRIIEMNKYDYFQRENSFKAFMVEKLFIWLNLIASMVKWNTTGLKLYFEDFYLKVILGYLFSYSYKRVFHFGFDKG